MYNEELRKFWPLPNIIKNHGEFDGRNTCAWESLKCDNSFVGESEGKSSLGKLRVDGLVILKWMLRKGDVRMPSEFDYLRIETCSGVLWTCVGQAVALILVQLEC